MQLHVPALDAHRPEPTDPPNPAEPDTVPEPSHEPIEPVAPPIGDPPAPYISRGARRYMM
jgi:hypothetical protein